MKTRFNKGDAIVVVSTDLHATFGFSVPVGTIGTVVRSSWPDRIDDDPSSVSIAFIIDGSAKRLTFLNQQEKMQRL